MRREVTVRTTPEPCESCGTRVAVTVRNDDGATRLSRISDNGRVLPGGHSSADCSDVRGRS